VSWRLFAAALDRCVLGQLGWPRAGSGKRGGPLWAREEGALDPRLGVGGFGPGIPGGRAPFAAPVRLSSRRPGFVATSGSHRGRTSSTTLSLCVIS
jgi:hypothetical protein